MTHLSQEMPDAMRGELRRALETAARQAFVLESIAAQVVGITGDVREDARHTAHELRGAVQHATTVLAEIQHACGRIEAAAAIGESIK